MLSLAMSPLFSTSSCSFSCTLALSCCTSCSCSSLSCCRVASSCPLASPHKPHCSRDSLYCSSSLPSLSTTSSVAEGGGGEELASAASLVSTSTNCSSLVRKITCNKLYIITVH